MEEQQETAGKRVPVSSEKLKALSSGHGQDRKELWPRCYYETGR